MAADDDSHAVDRDGNLVLAGLTAEETKEFRLLDQKISQHKTFQPARDEQSYSSDEKRWLILLEKHLAAIEPFVRMPRTRH
jgi:hypothetical protein